MSTHVDRQSKSPDNSGAFFLGVYKRPPKYPRVYHLRRGLAVESGGHFDGTSALKVKNAKAGKHAKPGQAKNAKAKNEKIVLSDGGGLRLDVDKNGNKSWVFRYTQSDRGL